MAGVRQVRAVGPHVMYHAPSDPLIALFLFWGGVHMEHPRRGLLGLPSERVVPRGLNTPAIESFTGYS